MTRKSFRFMADLAGLVLLAAALALSGCEDPNSSSGTSTPADDGAVTIYSHAVSPTHGVPDISWEAAEGASSYTVKYGLTDNEAEAAELDAANVDVEKCTASLPDSAAVAFGTEYYVWVSSDTGVKYSGHGAVHFTEDDLANIGKDENLPLTETYTLSRDLDLTGYVDKNYTTGTGGWIPLGKYDLEFEYNYLKIPGEDKAKIFSGTLDGGGKTIKNLELSQYETPLIGLFGAIVGASNEQPAVIKDLTIELAPLGTKEGSSNNLSLELKSIQSVGVLAGYIENVNIKNVTMEGSLGVTKVSGTDVTEATTTPYVGGLAGRSFSSITIENCTSKVSLDIKYETESPNIPFKDVYAGGFLGFSFSSGSTICSNISNVDYSGEITVITESSHPQNKSHNVYAGGLVGFIGTNSGSQADITGVHVKNTEISATGRTTNIGGIAGYVDGANLSYCSFDGSISGRQELGTGGGASKSYAGGIAGYVNTSSGNLEKCWTSGQGITSSFPATSTSVYAGGIAGYTNQGIQNCYTTFKKIELTVQADTTGGCSPNVGGIVGESDEKTIKNCYSAVGNITVNNAPATGGISIGGIAGYGTTNATAGNIVFEGNITAVYSGNIYINRISSGDEIATNNYAAGTVTLKKGPNLENLTEVTPTDSLDGTNLPATVDANFYKNTLGWSENIWDFSSLLPTLKPAAN